MTQPVGRVESAVMGPIPMFPLGSVLLPGVAMPLRIFEPRYQRLLADILTAGGIFGIVLIERGAEVGGGDERFSVGTLARIIQHQPNGDGSHNIVVGGNERIRVDQWLDDDPYPRATISGFPDEVPQDADSLNQAFQSTIASLRRLLARSTEENLTVPPATFDMAEDPTQGSYLLSALIPVGQLDRQHLLEASGPKDRLTLLDQLIDDQLALF